MTIPMTRTWRIAAAALFAGMLWQGACEGASNPGGGGDTDTDTDGDCDDGQHECQGDGFFVCAGGAWVLEEECTGETPFCDPVLGCVACIPDDLYCVGDDVFECNAEGSAGTYVETCDDGDTCVDGACTNSCLQAAGSKSYMGCEFVAVTTSNSLLASAFDDDFAVIIGNPSDQEANVTVSRSGGVVATDTVAPGSSQAIQLDYVTALKSAGESVLVTGGAYEITSDIPVVAYQYNPLHFSTADTSGEIYSYTNDASLLLPLHTLTGNYMASTWPTWGRGSWTNMPPFGVSGSWSGWSPGFMAVVGTADGTQVTVTAATYTLGGAIAALEPGDSAVVTLNRGDVLQVLSHLPIDSTELTFCEDMGWEQTTLGTCPPTLISECEGYCSVTDGDLTGTTVSASLPVAVFAGHNCTFMPYYAWACDHLEEMMFPLETWGNDFVMTAPSHPQGTGVVPTMYRVLAMAPGTTVAFEPAVHPTTALGAGELLQFESDQDFRITSGDEQIYVTQTMMGQDYFTSSDSGDPAMGSGVPVFQARSVYTFLTPDTYTYNFVNIVAPDGATVLLDDAAVGGWTTIGSSGYKVARVPLLPGSHLAAAEGDEGFGIMAYGYAPYTSYLFPGGMNIEEFIVE